MMRLVMVFAVPLLLIAGIARGERPTTPTGVGLGLDTAVSLGELKATPEMWFYDQNLRRYNDPKVAVRANAEMRAEQRLRRIESMRWFGLSNIRPRTSSDPLHGDYSAGWVSNPGYYPLRWNGVGQPVYLTR